MSYSYDYQTIYIYIQLTCYSIGRNGVKQTKNLDGAASQVRPFPCPMTISRFRTLWGKMGFQFFVYSCFIYILWLINCVEFQLINHCHFK